MEEEKIYKELINWYDFKEFDVDQEWNSFLHRTKESTAVNSGDNSSDQSAVVRRIPNIALSIAASLILLIGCMYFFNLKSEADIDPILAEEVVPIKTPSKTVAPEVEVITPQIEEKAPSIVSTPPPIRDMVSEPDPLVIIAKPLAVIESPKPETPASEFKRYELGEMIRLSDGSTVKTQTVAVLGFPQSFDGAEYRNVKIRSGLAEFDVVNNENQAFKVTTVNSEVAVLGTTFTFSSYGIKSTIKTIEGLVEFYGTSKPDVKVNVNPGEEYMFDGSSIIALNKEVEEDPTPPLEPKTYQLQHLIARLKLNYPDILNLKSKAIKKSLRETEVELPQELLASVKAENLAKIVEILNEKFEMTFEKGDCADCFIISAIKIKDE